MQWDNFGQSAWFIVLLIIIYLSIKVYRWRERVKNNFADKDLLPYIFPTISSKKFGFKLIVSCLAIAFIILALMDPLYGKKDVEVKREGIDMVFALDLSTSMNAQDIAPSRLDKSKKFIEDMLHQLGGDRVGLVVFAANAYTISPLTYDYAALESYLNSANTELISNQGTDFKNAIEQANKVLDQSTNQSKIIVLISDGEDNEDSVADAIKIAKENNIHVVSIGVGTEKGATVPTFYNGYENGNKKDKNGNYVISKIQVKNLQKLAQETNGTFFTLNSLNEAISELGLYRTRLNKKEISVTTTKDMNHVFQWFLGIAIFLIFIELLTSEYKKIKKN